MQKASHNYKILIIPIANPIRIGLYRDNELIETITSEKKTSQILLPILMKFLDRYDISSIIYTRGPGSYMAIKLTYIMLKTIEITRGIEIVGCSAFELNGANPIKAIGNTYFIKQKETIITKKYEQPIDVNFVLTKRIDNLNLDKESEPLYIIPAVMR
ncbi:MAG: hypothetical protein QM493_00130 [Sulfurovum sp.]